MREPNSYSIKLLADYYDIYALYISVLFKTMEITELKLELMLYQNNKKQTVNLVI